MNTELNEMQEPNLERISNEDFIKKSRFATSRSKFKLNSSFRLGILFPCWPNKDDDARRQGKEKELEELCSNQSLSERNCSKVLLNHNGDSLESASSVTSLPINSDYEDANSLGQLSTDLEKGVANIKDILSTIQCTRFDTEKQDENELYQNLMSLQGSVRSCENTLKLYVKSQPSARTNPNSSRERDEHPERNCSNGALKVQVHIENNIKPTNGISLCNGSEFTDIPLDIDRINEYNEQHKDLDAIHKNGIRKDFDLEKPLIEPND